MVGGVGGQAMASDDADRMQVTNGRVIADHPFDDHRASPEQVSVP
jgi:hypothetical protein